MKKIEVPGMNTMIDCTNNLTNQGYTENFQVTEEGELKALSDEKIYKAEEICVPNFYRFESQNDPSDNSIIYVVETSDGKKGMLIDAYGVNADADISEFIKQVEDFQKKARTC